MAVTPSVGTINEDARTLAMCLLYNAVLIISKRKDKVSRERAEFFIKVLNDVCGYYGISMGREMRAYAENAFRNGDPHIESVMEIHRINSYNNQVKAISAIKVTCIDKWCVMGLEAAEFMPMYRRALNLLLITWGWREIDADEECDDLTLKIRKQREYYKKLNR